MLIEHHHAGQPGVVDSTVKDYSLAHVALKVVKVL
jgi:hypothetical protein